MGHAGWPLAEHRVGLTLACTTQETPESAHPVDSYRPRWSTTTLPLHSWSPTEGGGWWSVVTASLCSWLAWANPSHWPANSSQGSTTRGGCTQLTSKGTPQVPSLGDREAVPLDPTGQLLHRPHCQDTKSKQLSLIHRNTHREAAKMRT